MGKLASMHSPQIKWQNIEYQVYTKHLLSLSAHLQYKTLSSRTLHPSSFSLSFSLTSPNNCKQQCSKLKVERGNQNNVSSSFVEVLVATRGRGLVGVKQIVLVHIVLDQEEECP